MGKKYKRIKNMLNKRIGIFYGYVTSHGTLLANGKYIKAKDAELIVRKATPVPTGFFRPIRKGAIFHCIHPKMARLIDNPIIK